MAKRATPASGPTLFQKSLAEFVQEIHERKDIRLMPDGRASINDLFKKYFAKNLSIGRTKNLLPQTTLQKLDRGEHVHEESIRAYATALNLQGPDRSELFIRYLHHSL